MFEFVTGIVSRMGYAGIALLSLLENVFPPLPSELIMPLAGFVASRGELSLAWAIVAGSLGSFVGAVAWYEVGRRVGERRVRGWLDRRGHWLGMCGDDIDAASRWFRRRGAAAVLVGRLVPGVRTFVSIPAGFARMPRPAFLAYTSVGTVAWTALLALAGRMLGAQYARVSDVLDPITWIVVGLLVLLPLVRVVRSRAARGRGAPGEAGGGRGRAAGARR